ncbi:MULTISPECIES: peptide chain release factor N(5)-glutamine methyltransferase [unclassified Rathayibacter]|uniref:peptide chain release factor N(5)-glutamine methyltransferase n=1 Tax=unclassified Rathayibacter TaxID=2609250 RepID=UPI00188B1AF8|nr:MULTISPECIES: peptide chain release factor N(5)-glutamine methyltransferase [unclassified Rathayibacter]MBF4463512.1 peptide chain release factor N(5)-glutamine methyltransferase [Rathayibacter sp. VKM Ac-2879]MBF4504766.1 peptide chain release factor N(5)-glutamine methyltransferase [Rathayibacter sp. VKM Ac-2878]
MTRDVRALLAEAVGRLAAARVPTPDVDAELLLGHLLGLGRGELQARLITGLSVDDAVGEAFDRAIERRSAREPLQHITGVAPFRSLELAVGPGVFVPRPETEQVAQIAIDALRAVADPSPLAVDLGTGSGALALALAHEVPHARVIGVENATEAFIWARGNRERLGLENARIVFDDLARALPDLDGTVAVVVSNPPYIPAAAVPRDPEVRLYDPPSALYGGEDGLDVVRALSVTARRLLRPGGVLVIEHGELQGRELRELLAADGWRGATTQRDLTGRDRATVAVR